jgi:sugar/nucleoside kinase (ribokinase family)
VSAIAVVGSVAYDTIETPHGRVDHELGGAATHFAVAAALFTPVHLIAAAGDDFAATDVTYLAGRGVDVAGLERKPGRSLSWHGRYHEDMNRRDTLAFDPGVFAGFDPRLTDGARRAPFVFLGVIDPEVQARTLDQLERPRLVGLDTIEHYIVNARDALVRLLPRVDLLVVNDEEARMLSGEGNVVRAARVILEMGARTVLVKRGEYGAILFSPGSVFAVPAYPLERVFDPTGAGDTFAGGLMGYLAAAGDTSEPTLRRAIVYGSVLASFVVEDFGGRRMRALTRDDVDRRYRQFVALTEF